MLGVLKHADFNSLIPTNKEYCYWIIMPTESILPYTATGSKYLQCNHAWHLLQLYSSKCKKPFQKD